MAEGITKPEIYLDYHATTPVLPEVLAAMQPYFCDHFGNANSTHQWGWRAEMAIAKAMKQIADLIHAKPSQVYVTSGATESLHWVTTGWARKNPGGLIVTTTTEHKATYGACELANDLGAKVEIIGVDNYGRVDLNELKRILKSSVPTLFTFILGNNEIGTLNPLDKIVELKKDFPNLKIHADAAQCVGKIEVDFENSGLDYLSFSGHKLYGPKGIGALVIKDKDSLKPLFSGGGQQRDMRAGTLDVPSVVGLGAACAWATDHLIPEKNRLMGLRNSVISALLETGEVILNGHPEERLPNNISLTFKNVTLDKLLLKLPKVGFSTSSACTSGSTSVSHVLKAIGRSDQEARQTVRFGLGHGTTQEQVDYLKDKLLQIVNESKNFSLSPK